MTENGAIKYFYKRMELGDIENDTQQNAYEMAVDALEEIQNYRALGTVEELMVAKEKQIPKKPMFSNMTESEAINRLRDHFRIHNDGRPTPHLNEAVSMAINALEKQIPKNPIKVDSGVNDYDFDYKCPNCEGYVDEGEHHCECGQALDWGD